MINVPDFVLFCGVLHSAPSIVLHWPTAPLKGQLRGVRAGGWANFFGAQFRESAPKFQTRAGAAATPGNGK